MADVAGELATEIRAQEKSRGGVCYEVILGESPGRRAPSPPQAQPAARNSPTAEAIEDKLRAAELRRESFKARRSAALAAQISRIEEASRKREVATGAFIASTKDALEEKMGAHETKRVQRLDDLKARVKEHIETVEKGRLGLERQAAEVRDAINGKLCTAAELRSENTRKMLDRLKEHEEQVRKVRDAHFERLQQLDRAIQEKLEQAHERKAQKNKELVEKLRNHNTVRLAEVKQVLESDDDREELAQKLKQRISLAEENRQKAIDNRLEAAKKYQIRAEIVRQNKAQQQVVVASEVVSSG